MFEFMVRKSFAVFGRDGVITDNVMTTKILDGGHVHFVVRVAKQEG